MKPTKTKQEKPLKHASVAGDETLVDSDENLTVPEAVQASQLEEASFVRVARWVRKGSHQFGWPALLLILVGPASAGTAPTPETFPIYLLIGTLPILCGLGLRLWARGYLRDEGFVLDGPYRYVRNPVELGAIVAYAGAAVLAGIDLWFIVVIVVLAVAYLSAVAASYEGDLLRKVGGPYLRYCRRVGRWIPGSLPGTNRTQRTYSTLRAVHSERESLLWVIGYLIVFAVRHRVPALTHLF